MCTFLLGEQVVVREDAEAQMHAVNKQNTREENQTIHTKDKILRDSA